jgi:hypothetical protein
MPREMGQYPRLTMMTFLPCCVNLNGSVGDFNRLGTDDLIIP